LGVGTDIFAKSPAGLSTGLRWVFAHDAGGTPLPPTTGGSEPDAPIDELLPELIAPLRIGRGEEGKKGEGGWCCSRD
jgi:hypothetical protein